MKMPNITKTTAVILGTLCLTLFAGAADVQAHDWKKDKKWDKKHKHHSYSHRHDSRGPYVRFYTPRTYVYYKSHRGYWESRNGIRVFIRVN